MKINKDIIYILIILALLVVGYFIIKTVNNQKKMYKEKTDLYVSSIEDTLTTTRNKLGQEQSKTGILTATNQKYFTQMQTKDADIKHLQTLLETESQGRRDIETALVVSNQTLIHVRDSAKNAIVGWDSTYPTYKKQFNRQWDSGAVILGRNIFDLSVININSYEWVMGTEPDGKFIKGWFKRKEFAQITNLNPNTQTKTMKVYHASPVGNKPLKVGLGSGAVGFIACELLHFFKIIN
jgi:hypothetical protein